MRFPAQPVCLSAVLMMLGFSLALPADGQTPAGESAPDGLIAAPEPGWPQWRGPRRDGVSEEKGLLPSWPEGGPKLLWRVEGLGKGWSSPIVVGERVYITGDMDDDLVVWAFDVNGGRQWKTVNGKSWTGSFPGARAACTFSEGRLYHMNAHGRLACLDAGTGREVWNVAVLERFAAENIQWALSECLLVEGARVIVTPGGKKCLMAALDKTDGRTVWTTESLDGERASYSSPILFRWSGRRLIANCSAAHGFGVDADTGRLQWTVPLRNRFETNVSTPIYGAGCVFYVTPYAEEGRLYRLKADGSRITAELAWEAPLDTVTGAGVLVGEDFFTSGYRKNKHWMAVDWNSGRTKSQLTDFTTGAAVYADGRLYCFDEAGKVGLLKPGADSLAIAGQFRLLTERVHDAWAHPVLCAGRLYLRYHDRLWCYAVR